MVSELACVWIVMASLKALLAGASPMSSSDIFTSSRNCST